MLKKLEKPVSLQMGDVCRFAREQIVDADDAMAFSQKPLAEMRAEEAGAAGDYGGDHEIVTCL